MAFVEMKNAWFDPEFSQQPHPADSKQHLLNDTRLAIAAVKMSSHPAIGFLIVRNVCIQQVKRDSAYVRTPNSAPARCARESTPQPISAGPRQSLDLMQRQLLRISLTIYLFLPAFDDLVAGENIHSDKGVRLPRAAGQGRWQTSDDLPPARRVLQNKAEANCECRIRRRNRRRDVPVFDCFRVWLDQFARRPCSDRKSLAAGLRAPGRLDPWPSGQDDIQKL